MRKLAQMPQFGTKRDEVLPGLRIASLGKAVIAFRVDDGSRVVAILAITHGGADWQARVRERG